MGEARLKQERKTAEKRDAEKRLDKGLKDTFPASDPAQATQPGGGITGSEPPPAGQKTGREARPQLRPGGHKSGK